MYSNRQVQESLLQLHNPNENPAFGLRPKAPQVQPGYTEPVQQMYYVPNPSGYPYVTPQPPQPQRGNGFVKALATITGMALASGALYIALTGNFHIKPLDLNRTTVVATAAIKPFTPPQPQAPVSNSAPQAVVRQPAIVPTALPLPAQQVQDQAPVVPTAVPFPTAQIAPQPTALPVEQARVIPDGTDRRFVPTAVPTAVPPTIMPVPQYTTTINNQDEQCVNVPSANNKVCDASGLRMDKATQDWVASMAKAGLIHPPTETSK